MRFVGRPRNVDGHPREASWACMHDMCTPMCVHTLRVYVEMGAYMCAHDVRMWVRIAYCASARYTYGHALCTPTHEEIATAPYTESVEDYFATGLAKIL